jgi:hypothetical protein
MRRVQEHRQTCRPAPAILATCNLVTAVMRDNADRPLEAFETKMRLQASRIMCEVLLYVNLRTSRPVVRGRVELPTFRFSVLRITVHDRPPRFICLAQNLRRPLAYSPARTRMRQELRRRRHHAPRCPGLGVAPQHPVGRAPSSRHTMASSTSSTGRRQAPRPAPVPHAAGAAKGTLTHVQLCCGCCRWNPRRAARDWV